MTGGARDGGQGRPADKAPVSTPPDDTAEWHEDEWADRGTATEESTSVMRELMRQAMDDGYSLAAAQPDGGKSRGGRWTIGFVAAVVLVGVLLTIAAIQTRQSQPALAKEKQQLIDRIDTQTGRVDALAAQSVALQEEVNALQDEALARSGAGNELRRELRTLGVLAGTERVEGSGIRILVDDGPEEGVTGDPEDAGKGRILDIDLQQAVNGLWSAGAEAVAINGQRITALTAIRGADQSITVNYRPLARPYVIEAVGDLDTLPARFAESDGGGWLYVLKSSQNIRLELTPEESLTLPAASSTQLRYARTEGSR
jgi:uncharacterized protein YlxW (UPF0749 family)